MRKLGLLILLLNLLQFLQLINKHFQIFFYYDIINVNSHVSCLTDPIKEANTIHASLPKYLEVKFNTCSIIFLRSPISPFLFHQKFILYLMNTMPKR